MLNDRPTATMAHVVLAAAMVLASSTAVSAQTPPPFVPPLLTREQVMTAVEKLDGVVKQAMKDSGVPGVAVAVVYQDQTIVHRGYGVRNINHPQKVDGNTVFQLASVSKPIASTVVAAVVGKQKAGWTDPARRYLPGFALSDPYVTANATIADLLSHSSGLATGAGDLLEDLGYDRAYILAHIDRQPLDSFRSSYHYSNFGYTMGAVAAAAAAGMSWEDLADTVLFKPLGMTRSSFRYSDFAAQENRASLHVRAANGEWVPKFDRKPDPQSPAGGASASIDDVARFMRLQLGGGSFEGKPVIDPAALAVTHAPHAMPALPRTPLSRAGFYGLGWNVNYDDRGRLEIGHSGAFYLGGSTYVGMIPGEQLGIAVLTNGEPIGLPEGIARTFFDIAETGKVGVDWFALFARVFAATRAAEEAPFAYGKPPANARPPRDLPGYAGRYDNAYYGPVAVTVKDGTLAMTIGPRPETLALTPYDGDIFTFRPVGENAVPQAGVTFRRAPGGAVAGLVIDFYDRTGLGSFERAAAK